MNDARNSLSLPGLRQSIPRKVYLMKRLLTVLTGLVFILTVWAPHARGQTIVYDGYGQNGAGGEWNLYNTGVGSWPGDGIMEYLYGAGHFTRVDDSSDIQWISTGTGTAGIVGVYAGASQNLYATDLVGGSPSFIVNPPGTGGYAPQRFFNGGEVSFTPPSQPFLFLDDATYYTLAYSDPLLNGGTDRMVALAVTGYLATPGDVNSWTPFSDGTTHYVIGFEDGSDFDYQDLVIELTGIMPVPEPVASQLLVLLGIICACCRRRELPRRFPVLGH